MGVRMRVCVWGGVLILSLSLAQILFNQQLMQIQRNDETPDINIWCKHVWWLMKSRQHGSIYFNLEETQIGSSLPRSLPTFFFFLARSCACQCSTGVRITTEDMGMSTSSWQGSEALSHLPGLIILRGYVARACQSLGTWLAPCQLARVQSTVTSLYACMYFMYTHNDCVRPTTTIHEHYK